MTDAYEPVRDTPTLAAMLEEVNQALLLYAQQLLTFYKERAAKSPIRNSRAKGELGYSLQLKAGRKAGQVTLTLRTKNAQLAGLVQEFVTKEYLARLDSLEPLSLTFQIFDIFDA